MKASHGLLPQIRINKSNPEKMQQGFTLTNFYNWELRVPITAAIIDSQGSIRWFYQNESVPDARGDIDVRSDSEGILIGGTNIVEREDAVFPILVDWNQNVLWRGKMVNHHHIHRRQNGNFIFLAFEMRKSEKHSNNIIGSDIIVEVDSKSNRIVWMWRMLDHIMPETQERNLRDWSHCNTIEEDVTGRYLYLSARNLNSIFKIDTKTQEIIWRLGEKGDFKMMKEDLFYHQHSPELQSNGNILLFDNGRVRDRSYSRAIELEIDEDSMKAKSVWKWGKEINLFTPIWGDADRLENGNTLLTFGTRTHPNKSRLIEVTDRGEIVWDLELFPSGWGMYRAERLKLAGTRMPVSLM